MKYKNVFPLLITLTLVVLIGLGFAQFSLPDPLPSDAPAAQFSAGRALDLLRELTNKPHPTGSVELVEIREDLTNQLQTLGLEVEIQSTTGSLPQYYAAGHTDNILARLPGKNSSGAVLLIAHYDSVPQGPGAGDNGSGVVTILETLRALQNDLPLENDLIVLFTDAEEYGTLGAQAFAAQHPWMQEIAVTLNIEGTLKGSVVLVETGPKNGWFVRNFQEASPHPIGYAWLYDLFGMMPNLTDFMPFRQAGLTGGNLFAFNGGSQYHTPRDTIENMDPGSLQRHGEQTLALVKHFGAADLTNTHAPDVIYFNIFGSWMVVYPASWVMPLSLAAGLFVLLALLRLRRRTHPGLKQLGFGLLAAFSNLIAAPLVVTLAWGMICKLHPQYTLYFPAHTYNDGWYAAAFSFLAGALSLLLFSLWRRRLNWQSLLEGALILIGLINIAISLIAPGFSYLFTWPLLFGTIALWAFPTNDLTSARPALWTLPLLIIPAVELWLPVGAILFWSSGLGFLAAIALAVVIPLMLGAPLLEVLGKQWRRGLVVGLLAAALVGCIGGALTGSFDADHPMPLRVEYFYNADTGEAYWINPTGLLSDWQEQFINEDTRDISWSELFPPFQSTILATPAPAANLLPPEIEILSDNNQGSTRQLHLRLTPARGGDQLILAFPPGTALLDAQVEGQPWMNPVEAPPPLSTWQMFFYAVPPETGIEVELTIATPGPEFMLIAERSVGFDTLSGLTLAPRPDSIISLGDYVYVSQRCRLEID